MPHLSVFLFILLVLLCPVAKSAHGQQCENQAEVIVLAADAATAAEVCRVAERAITFLSQFDITPQRTISFTIVEQQIDNHGYDVYGNYDSRRDGIQLMSYAAIQNSVEKPMIFAEPFDRVHYAGVIAHEVAHAVVQHNLKKTLRNSAAQEYLAYSTQLAALPKERRDVIITAMDVVAWASGDAISDTYMAMNPGKFAVKSYKHLTGLAEPGPFIEILLNSNWFYIKVP